MYLVGARVAGNARFGALTAALFALTPLLILHARPEGDALPFVASWLACAVLYADGRDARWLLIGGGALGLGLYSALASLVMMPAYLVITVLWLAAYGTTNLRPYVAAVGAFGVAAAPLAVFLARQPDYLVGEIMRLRMYDARAYGAVHGLREIVNWIGITARSGTYYDYFNPSFLFLSGTTLTDTLQHPQVFLLPIAVLLPAGIYRVVKRGLTPAAALTVAGFLVSPLAASLPNTPDIPGRILWMLPFAALLSAHGATQWLSSPKTGIRGLAWTLLAAVPVSFVYFLMNRFQ